MAVTYGFYNALEHDRLYDAIQMSSIFDGIIQDGIFSTIGTSMIVTAPEDGMYVNVGPGRAWFNHTWTYNDTIYPIEAEEAEVVLDRIDAVVLEVNSAAEVRANRIYFVKGTPSSDPVKPTMIHNPEVNQYALAYVHIRAGQTTIFQSDIENAVGTDETPFVTGLLQQVSIENLLLQWDNEFHRYFANFKRVSEADLLTWFNARKDEYDAWYADMEREGAEDLATFDAWFQHMKDQLDSDAAGHLQAEIDELAEACEKGSVLIVTTDEPDLIGRTCTVSQGLNSINKIFDANGVAEFPSVPYIGNDIDVRATYGDNIAQTVLTIPYFGRYGADIAFWAATLDIRTTVNELYGRTITISKGGSVVGTTTFDNTGHAVYKVHETGTYHIYTSTAGGDVYEDDIVVTEETLYSIELGLPNGSTAIPVNDIQLWLKCAGITDKEYLQTLDDVLNEPETFEILLSDSNACNYMARSTAWALAEGLVPAMTSNTTPSGEVFGSSPYSGNELWKAFDGDPSTLAASGTSSTSREIGYHFTSATPVKVFKYNVNFSTAIDVGISIAYSDDGTNYTTATETFTYTTAQNGTDVLFKLSNDYGSHEYWKLILTTSANRSNIAYTIQFYSNGDITTDADAMRILGKYDYACEALLSDSTWASAIVGSSYFESVLNVKVPTMTSATAPSGEVISSGAVSGQDAYKAFDGNTGTYYESSTKATSGSWIGYVFPTPVEVSRLVHVHRQAIDAAQTMKVQYSDDGSTWSDTGTTYIQPAAAGTETVNIIRSGAHRYWRTYLVSTSTAQRLYIYEIQFYGRHEAQTDIIHSAANDTIYYLDNGSPVTLCTTDANGIGEVDWSDLPTGDITLYSSVAKDPDNLSNDYHRSIRVTKNKVDGYLMPIGAIYWYGYTSSLFTKDIGAKTTVSQSGGSVRITTNALNTNDYTLVATEDSTGIGILGKTITNSIDLTNYDTVKVIGYRTGTSGDTYRWAGLSITAGQITAVTAKTTYTQTSTTPGASAAIRMTSNTDTAWSMNVSSLTGNYNLNLISNFNWDVTWVIKAIICEYE